jgi:hypothetical protein
VIDNLFFAHSLRLARNGLYGRPTACVSRALDGQAFPTEMAFYRIRDRKIAGRQASRLHAVLRAVLLMSCYEFRVR